VFSVIVIAVTVIMTQKNTRELSQILEESIKSELISTSIAARGHIDVDRFYSYNSLEDIQNDFEAFSKTLGELRELQRIVGATYIYALKQVDGVYHFIFDTDEEDDVLFDIYEISDVHERAFLGYDSAGIMNVVDEYGNFSTGAVPIWREGIVVGIISTDIEDSIIHESNKTAARNSTILISVLAVTMAVMTIIVWFLLRNVRAMQEKLYQMANYDVLTGLPNRQHLMIYLEEVAEKALKHNTPFAFLLIDLDNFKSVNDGAGHDAGDELLRHFALYLNVMHDQSKSFRPLAGALNVSARIGGDEFVQIIPGIGTEEEAQEVAKKLLENFSSQTVNRYVEKYHVGLSIGVALFPLHTDNYNVLIKYADFAMYHAKKRGKNSFHVYSEDVLPVGDFIIEPEVERPEGFANRRQFRR